MKSAQLSFSLVQQLHYAVLKMDEKERSYFLQKISASGLLNKNACRQYYYLLLFMAGYSISEIELELVKNELNRVEEFLSTQKLNFENSLLPCTKVVASFSLAFCNSLLQHKNLFSTIHSVGADNKLALAILKLITPLSARDERDNPEPAHAFMLIKKLSGKTNSLQWLSDSFNQLEASAELKENLFQQLLLFVEWKSSSWLPWKLVDFPIQKMHHQNVLIKHSSLHEIISSNNIRRIKINSKQKQSLIYFSENILGNLLRETDPVTYAETEATTYWSCGGGMTVALFSMQVEKRLALESYVGYVAFKNNLPLAYGGAWITGTHARIGINIFPWFRGGESALTFCQLMAVYHHQFKVNTFTVEPYQIGKGNRDGIKSGAFWFYYRLGFRPLQENLLQLSKDEWEKISENKSYRSSIGTLKLLANANLFLQIEKNNAPIISSQQLSGNINKFVANQFNGDRKAAIEFSFQQTKKLFTPSELKRLTDNENFWLKELSLFLASQFDLKKLEAKEKSNLKKFIQSKAVVDEKEFAMQWQRMKLTVK